LTRLENGGKGMEKKIFRLNRKYSSNYALFIIEGDVVTYKHFEFYTGPLVEEKSLSLEEGRELYREMVSNKVKPLSSDVYRIDWVPATEAKA
jgi:hypothetical protein